MRIPGANPVKSTLWDDIPLSMLHTFEMVDPDLTVCEQRPTFYFDNWVEMALPVWW